jgi:hypothetical protein
MGYFVGKITILRQKNHILSNFRGVGGRRVRPPWIRLFPPKRLAGIRTKTSFVMLAL